MNSLDILHLSDLHMGNFRYEKPEILAIKIANTLVDQGKKVELIILSGDIFDGRSKTDQDDINNAIIFFRTLIDRINTKNINSIPFDENNILFIPGNHDLVRNQKNLYEKYDCFIKKFYPNGQSKFTKVIDDHNFICHFPEKRIAVLGLNSCRLKAETLRESELKWIESIDLSGFPGKESAIRAQIYENQSSKINWDDFGYIDSIEMDNLFTALGQEIPSYDDYTIIATFHHHFYPFPELVSNRPDASFIRNYTEVMSQFQRHKIRLVLHGHKHLSIHRAITDGKYFENPESIVYVLSAGSIGCKDVFNPSFQWLRVFEKNAPKIAEIEKYDFKDEEPVDVKPFSLPPQPKELQSVQANMLDVLRIGDPKLYEQYRTITNNFEQIFLDNDIEKTINLVGGLFTMFEDIKLELKKNPKTVFLLLITINFRTIFLKNLHEPQNGLEGLLDLLKRTISDLLDNSPFSENLNEFLSSTTNVTLEHQYNLIIKNVSGIEKRQASFSSLAMFVTDLLLNISRYGEYYFEKENLNHKINIKLNIDTFYNNIPNQFISIEGNIDRRAILISFKAKDPTVHKVAVLIVKDFEMRLDKFEDSLKEIGLKLYYVIPKVTSENYDLENFHFDAYIPTLLPLLTGENLYKSREVFIRELVQNAIDATLLRQKLQHDVKIDHTIRIEMGTEIRGTKKNKYFRIIDNGIGMSKFTIERYFTSIGRSFYVSEEFDDLQKDNNIKYEAISNFGIGFLSSFMVCNEVMVKTKNISIDTNEKGLEIEIPNYQGCFFVRNIEKEDYGTMITLYEDDRKHFNFTNFTDYIKETLIGLPVPIAVNYIDDPSKNFEIEPFQLHERNLDNLQKREETIFYVPFSEQTKAVGYISWDDLYKSDINSVDKFGVWFNIEKAFNKKHQASLGILCANQGLKISTPFTPFFYDNNNFNPEIVINYPSSFIQLDVAREEINSIKHDVDLTGVPEALRRQFLEMMSSRSEKLQNTILNNINASYRYVQKGFKKKDDISISGLPFVFRIENIRDSLVVTICQTKDIPSTYDNKTICYWEFSSEESYARLITYVNNLPISNYKKLSDIDFKAFLSPESLKTIIKMLEEFRRKEIKSVFPIKVPHFKKTDVISLKNLKLSTKLRENIEIDLILLVKNLERYPPFTQEQNTDILKYILAYRTNRKFSDIRESFIDAMSVFKILTMQTLTFREAINFRFTFDLNSLIVLDPADELQVNINYKKIKQPSIKLFK